MAYCESAAERVRTAIGRDVRLTEKKMFGGLAFLLHGNMCVCVSQDVLILRVGKDAWHTVLEEEHVREFEMTGRSMSGWVVIDPDGYDTDQQLRRWLLQAIAFTETLPPK